jgi:hypothetical protein
MTERETPESDPRTTDEERGVFGSAGWDASDDDQADGAGLVGTITEPVGEDVPRPDPEQDQG